MPLGPAAAVPPVPAVPEPALDRAVPEWKRPAVPGRSAIASALPLASPSDARALDDLLRERLTGRRLIAEVGLDAQLFEELTSVVEEVLRTSDLDHLARSYTYVFLTFMVGHGVYGYHAGNYWGTMPVAGVDNAAGPLFRRRCADTGFEDFDYLVHDDNATKYVGPILAHGGIPKYCLGDFFSLVIKDMQRAGGSAEELLAHWRTKKTAFFNIDKPVGRFLLYGGDLAVDLLDRCLSAIQAVQLTNRFPTPAETGLPSYILVGLRKHVEEIRQTPRHSIQRSDVLRPELLLDPWSPFGPEVILPPVRSDAATTWRLWSSKGIEDVTTSSFEVKQVALEPAKVWRLELLEAWCGDAGVEFRGLRLVAGDVLRRPVGASRQLGAQRAGRFGLVPRAGSGDLVSGVGRPVSAGCPAAGGGARSQRALAGLCGPSPRSAPGPIDRGHLPRNRRSSAASNPTRPVRRSSALRCPR